MILCEASSFFALWRWSGLLFPQQSLTKNQDVEFFHGKDRILILLPKLVSKSREVKLLNKNYCEGSACPLEYVQSFL